MRDERTELLTCGITWIDGVPSNVGKFWQKWRWELEQEGKKTENMGKTKGFGSGLKKHYIE